MQSLNQKNRTADYETLWSRPFVFLNISFFFVFTNIGFLYLYPLALQDMGIRHHAIGWAMGLFSVAAVISRPFIGKLTVQKGEYWVISLGMVLSFFACLAYILITAFGPAMLLTRLIHGIGFSAYISGGFSLAAKEFSPLKRGKSFSIVGVALMGAIALAPSFGEILVRGYGFLSLYLAAAASMILAWFAILPAVHPLPRLSQKGHEPPVKYMSLLKDRSFFFLLCSTLIFAHCQSTVSNFLALIAAEKGASSGGFFFASYSSAILVLLTTGGLVDRYGKVFLLSLSYPFFSLGIVLMPGLIQSTFCYIPPVLFGTGMGLLFSTHNALAASHGTMREKPAVMSVFTCIYDAGFVTGAIFSGWLAHQIHLDALFVFSGFFALLGFFIVFLSPIKDN
ncbi:MAG: MFS transporter [Thermodesulfobacteriota bacterium]|nr:MFS transporter [Thermodesulfobacteriota bacterium]